MIAGRPCGAAGPMVPPMLEMRVWSKLAPAGAALRSFLTPDLRMVDELECMVSVLLAIALAHLLEARNISWAAFSGYMVMRGTVSESLFRGSLRIVGTAAGTALALALVPVLAPSLPGRCVAAAAVGGVTLYGALTARHAYAWLFVGLTFEMILFDKIEYPGHALIDFALTRNLEVVAGTSACVLVSMVSAATLRRRYPAPPAAPPAALGWHPQAARHAGQAAVALALVPALDALQPIPELAQTAVTIMAVMLLPAAGIGASGLVPVSRRLVHRIAGCLAGAMAAAVVLVAARAAPAQVAPALVMAATALGVMLGRHIENSGTRYAYAGTQFTLAVLVTLVPDSYDAAQIAPALERLAGILAGMAVLEPVLVAWHLAAPERRASRGPDTGGGREMPGHEPGGT